MLIGGFLEGGAGQVLVVDVARLEGPAIVARIDTDDKVWMAAHRNLVVMVQHQSPRPPELVTYDLPDDYFQTYRDHVEAVTAEDVARVAKKYLDPDHLTIVVVGDAAKIEEGLKSLPFGQANAWSFGLDLQQTIFDRSLMARNRMARAGEAQAEATLDAARSRALLEVAEAYYDAQLAERLLAIADSTLVQAERTFREIARLTGGAYLPFDQASAGRLAELLKAVATYAAGGFKALEESKGEGARLLLPHLRR